MLDPNLVPRDIREEMMQIYDEHGGVYLLSNLTKISINALNNWYRRWQFNPFVFRSDIQYRARKLNTFIKNVLNPDYQVNKPTKSQGVIVPESSVTEKIRSKITVEQEILVKSIKALIESKMKLGLAMDEEVENELRKLFSMIGDSRKVAILLGIDKNTVDGWVTAL